LGRIARNPRISGAEYPAPERQAVGTGLVSGVSWLVTGDEQWRTRLAQIASRIRVCYLGDFA
jgi:hypothetical protein